MDSSEQRYLAVTDPVIRELALRGRVRTFPKHSMIINQGERGDTMYIVLSGTVQVYVSDARGREMVLDDYGVGDYFGEMALDGSPRSASVRALDTVVCSVVSIDTLRESLKNADIALKLVLVLIERIRAVTESAAALALNDVYTRVRNLFNTLARPGPNGTRVIAERMTHQWIANRVGAHRDMVCRICIQLVKGEYVSVVDKHYTLLRTLPERF